MNKKIIIIGAGVAGINAATKLIDNGYPAGLITIIDKGKDPFNRPPEDVMEGMLGAGGWSDGKLTYHTSIGGQLSKYCGEAQAMNLMEQVISNFRRFHPEPDQIFCSDPLAEPEFIKPYFGLKLFPVWHIGSNFLHDIAKAWYKFLVDKGVNFKWETEVTKINFKDQEIRAQYKQQISEVSGSMTFSWIYYEILIFAVGKSGIDFGKKLAEENKLPTEPKSVQIGVRFEAPQKYFQKLIDVSYDFKLYRKFEKEGVSLRTFCTNNNAAYVAVEDTYGDISYNGHAKKGEEFRNNMTNFGILMEIKDIDKPFDWSRELVSKVQRNAETAGDHATGTGRCGLYFSPGGRRPGLTSEGGIVKSFEINDVGFQQVKDAFLGYFDYIEDFITDMGQVFPDMGTDWGIYVPEVKYLSPEPLVDYDNLALINYPNIHFVGDALSARGITVSGAQGIYVAENILKN